jgi:hypothetical protein
MDQLLCVTVRVDIDCQVDVAREARFGPRADREPPDERPPLVELAKVAGDSLEDAP